MSKTHFLWKIVKEKNRERNSKIVFYSFRMIEPLRGHPETMRFHRGVRPKTTQNHSGGSQKSWRQNHMVYWCPHKAFFTDLGSSSLTLNSKYALDKAFMPIYFQISLISQSNKYASLLLPFFFNAFYFSRSRPFARAQFFFYPFAVCFQCLNSQEQ